MAVGIGLVFGVLRLVNFAYGQLIMAGGFALAYGATWNLPEWESILLCFGVVLVLSVLMDRLVFRPLRTSSPAVMLVATFAVAFLLQNIALLKFGPLPKSVGSLAQLNAPWDIFGVEIKKIAVIAVATAAGCLVILQLLLTRTPLGLHMRAAAMDFRTARLLGVRANRVIGAAVIISGLLAATAAVFLSAQAIERRLHVRPPGHDHRARRRGGRRDEPADPGDARRLLDRLRDRDPRRRAARRTRASTCRASSSRP